jgi:hypothetical protein
MNDINALRRALFETLAALRDKEKPLDIERAKAINETAQTLINTAKVEVDFCRVTGQTVASGFLPASETPKRLSAGVQKTATGTKTVTTVPGATITTHHLE